MNIQDSALVLGLQSGNEGKTKIIQNLFPRAHAYVRFNGSAETPHLLHGKKGSVYVYHIPTGVIYPDALAIIGQGVFLNISILREEIELLLRHGIAATPGKIKISNIAPIIMPWHIALDALDEKENFRGLRSATAGYIARKAIRAEDVFMGNFEDMFMMHGEMYNRVLQSLGGKIIPLQKAFGLFMEDMRFLEPYIESTHLLINDLLADGKQVVFESAGGMMLDVFHGPYPFVLPSLYVQTIPHHTVGVFKPYVSTTPFGMATMPVMAKTADQIRTSSHEYDAITDNPREIGWLDIPMLRAALCTGIDDLALVKLDALTAVDEVYVCTNYVDVYNDRDVPYIPGDGILAKNITKQYESFPTWKGSLQGIREYMDMPRAARNLVEAIEGYLDKKIQYISTGPGIDDFIVR